jgi:hypothetical protein
LSLRRSFFVRSLDGQRAACLSILRQPDTDLFDCEDPLSPLLGKETSIRMSVGRSGGSTDDEGLDASVVDRERKRMMEGASGVEGSVGCVGVYAGSWASETGQGLEAAQGVFV